MRLISKQTPYNLLRAKAAPSTRCNKLKLIDGSSNELKYISVICIRGIAILELTYL